MVGEFEVGTQREEETENKAREAIPYRKLYQFNQWYDIFRIPVNTGVPFRVYRYFI